MTHHKTNQGRQQKLGAAVMRFHANAMREEEVRKSKHGQERLKALKANDEEAYLRLLDKTKVIFCGHRIHEMEFLLFLPLYPNFLSYF